MSTIALPRLLLIAGNGRNSGKTTFACNIIRKFSSLMPLVAFKISSPLHHGIEPSGKIIVNIHELLIQEEDQTETGKDSSRMLAAGADRSFFIAASDEHLGKVLPMLLDLSGKDVLLVGESGGLRKWVRPGLFFIMNPHGRDKIKDGIRELIHHEHTWIDFDGVKPDFDMNRIVAFENRWILLKHNDNI